MTFLVRETTFAHMHERTIVFGLLVLPGQPIPRHNYDGPPDPPITRAQLVTAHTDVVLQAGRVWRPFEVHSDHEHIRYSFQFNIDITEDLTPVRRRVTDTERHTWTEDMSDPDHTKGHAAALAEAMARGLSNIAVVHPVLGSSACAPFVETGGSFGQTPSSTEHPGLLARTSNMMSIGLADTLGNGYDTAAHEIGHMMGLRDRLYHDGNIMGYVRRGAMRVFGAREQERLHTAVQAPLSGVTVDSHRLPRSALPRRSPHSVGRSRH